MPAEKIASQPVKFILHDGAGKVLQLGSCPAGMVEQQGQAVGLHAIAYGWDVPDASAYCVGKNGRVYRRSVKVGMAALRETKLQEADDAFAELLRGILGPFAHVHRMKREGKLLRDEGERARVEQRAAQQDAAIEQLETARMRLKGRIRGARSTAQLSAIRTGLLDIVSELDPESRAEG